MNLILRLTRTRKCYNIFSHLFLFWRFRNQYHSISQKKSSAKSCPGRGSNMTHPSLAQKPRQRFFSNAVRFFDRKLLTDLADFQYQTIKELCASCIKIWRKSDQNCDRESAATRKCKMAAMTSSNSKFQKPRKMTLANILKIICVKFHQNRFIRLGCRDDTHRHTHTHTHTQTHTQTHTHPGFDCNIFSQNDWI